MITRVFLFTRMMMVSGAWIPTTCLANFIQFFCSHHRASPYTPPPTAHRAGRIFSSCMVDCASSAYLLCFVNNIWLQRACRHFSPRWRIGSTRLFSEMDVKSGALIPSKMRELRVKKKIYVLQDGLSFVCNVVAVVVFVTVVFFFSMRQQA